MNHLENYYANYDEEGRLISRHGQVEYRTTMKYIHEIINASDTITKKNDKSEAGSEIKILEVGAGTGRYSIALAKRRI